MTKKLESEFSDILNYRGINKDVAPLNLFDIGDTLYSENVISNWYAFFFDSEEEHKLSTLFLYSLLELINKKSNLEIEMDGCSVIREFGTGKGFIDLVLHDGDIQNINSAIIIENKVNASLNNDLNDYFSSIEVLDKKMGIVLSLNKVQYENDNFINITHYELTSVVKNNLAPYLIKASDKHLLYLKDFIETIELISKPLEMDEDIKFYIKNSKKINHLIELKNKTESFFTNSIKSEITKLENLEWFRKNKDSLTLTITNTNFRLYIYYFDLFETGEYRIEIWSSSKSDIEKFDSNLKNTIESNFQDLVIDWNKSGDRWLEIGYKEYEGIETKDFKNIGKLIFDQIEIDFSDLIEFLKKNV